MKAHESSLNKQKKRKEGKEEGRKKGKQSHHRKTRLGLGLARNIKWCLPNLLTNGKSGSGREGKKKKTRKIPLDGVLSAER